MQHSTFALGDPIRVLLLGIGQMGSGIARLITEKKGLELVGAYGRRPEHGAVDLGRAIGLERALLIPISADLGKTIESSRPQIAIQATCSRLAEALERMLERTDALARKA